MRKWKLSFLDFFFVILTHTTHACTHHFLSLVHTPTQKRGFSLSQVASIREG